MGIFDPSNLETAVTEVYAQQLRPGAANELRHAELTMVDALKGIVARAERLLADLADPATAWHAVAEAAQGAGASGPIGSLWEKALAAAVKAQTIGAYGMEPVKIDA
jgi:hypothetical protein